MILEASRRWVCQVVRSGYHNGASCRPGEPHGDFWDCGYRYELTVAATDEAREALEALGLLAAEQGREVAS
jgi:hypothetical protein